MLRFARGRDVKRLAEGAKIAGDAIALANGQPGPALLDAAALAAKEAEKQPRPHRRMKTRKRRAAKAKSS